MALQRQIKASPQVKPFLRCGKCGNSELFVEIMSYESHLIDANFNYLHLLDSDVDSYLCHLCGKPVELITSTKTQ